MKYQRTTEVHVFKSNDASGTKHPMVSPHTQNCSVIIRDMVCARQLEVHRCNHSPARRSANLPDPY